MEQQLPRMESTLHFQDVLRNDGLTERDWNNVKKHPHNLQLFQSYLACQTTYDRLILTSAEDRAPNSSPKVSKYMANAVCVGNVACPEVTQAWLACVNRVRMKEHGWEDTTCGLVKRQLERCLRATTERCVKATTWDMFY